MKTFRNMETPKSTWGVTEDKITIESNLGKSELVWKAFVKIWKFRDYWLLFYTNSNYSILPIKNINMEILDFIDEKIMGANNGQ